MTPYVITEDDIILSLAGSIARRQRHHELGGGDDMYPVTSYEPSIGRHQYSEADDFATNVYGNPAFQTDADISASDGDRTPGPGDRTPVPPSAMDTYPGRHSPRAQSPRLIRNV